MIDLDIISALQALGFTEYEAKVYCALVRHPGSTGYEIGGRSQVPRARVYEVLEGLQTKGFVYPQMTGTKQLYYPKPHPTMLDEMKEQLTRVSDEARALLDSMASQAPSPEFLVFTGEEHVLSRFQQLLRQTKVKLLVSGWPEDLITLAPWLKSAQDRGVHIYVVCFGEASLPVTNVFHHSVSPLQYVQVAVFGRWLQMVSDLKECFIGQMLGPLKSLGLWTQSPALAFTAAQWIYHDITVLALEKAVGPDAADKINLKTQQFLRSILAWPHDDPATQIKLPDNVPGVTEIFTDIERRFKSKPSLAKGFSDKYEFRLSGAGGGTFHVVWDAGLINVGTGSLAKADLVFEASADDFRAIVLGVLPLGALYEPGRINVRGDIRAASRIQTLFQR